jgi:transposase InsO family protein
MYAMVENSNLSINSACSVLGVNRSGYMKWLKRKPKSDVLEAKLKNEIQNIAVEFPRYGYRRITAELKRHGFNVNHKRVLKLMKEGNLLVKRRVFKITTTNSNHNFRIYPNLAKGLEVTAINQLWVADITYVRLVKEFVYLAVIEDVFSRRCIGWDLDRNIDAQLTLNALDMALSNRRGMDLSSLIHHSDQGIQYASNEYANRLGENGIRISMGRKGNPFDNAFVESLIKTIKYEEVYISEYETFEEAYENIRRFIEDVYNKKRLHSSIGYLPPIEFEKEVILNIRMRV